MTSARQWWIGLVAFIAISALLFFVLVSALGQATKGPSVYDTAPSPYDAHLTALDREALDQAYKAHRVELFASWMRDPAKQPERATLGAERARNVYIYIMNNINERPKK